MTATRADVEQFSDEVSHLRVYGGFAFGEGAIQVENDELFHD
jgi:hypothetical protein